MNHSISPERKPTVGIDVSEKYLQTCWLDEVGDISENSRFKNNEEKLDERFGSIEPLRIVLEVGSHSRWIAELLAGLGHEVLVVDPRKLKLISGSLNKSDAKDAERLAMLGQSFPHMLATVKLRNKEHQLALTLVRARGTLVKSRTLLVNAIRGLLKPYGIRIPKRGTASTFATFIREELPPEILVTVEPMLKPLQELNAAIATYDGRMLPELEKLAPNAVHLTQIHGVGAMTALYFVAMVGDPHRFAKTRSVGAYFGLTRKRSDSGDYVSELGITKNGDRYMRTLLVNCATFMLGPFGKDSDLRRWAERHAGEGSRAAKKKAKIAVARKLSVLLLAMWKSGADYEPLKNNVDAVPIAPDGLDQKVAG